MAQTSDHNLITALDGGVSGWNPALASHVLAEKNSGTRDRTLAEKVIMLSVICDVVVITLAMSISFWLRFHTFLNTYGLVTKVEFLDYCGYITVGVASMLFTLAYRQFYVQSVMLRFRKVARQILESSLIWVLAFLSISLILKFQPPVSRLYVGIAGLSILCGLLTSRWLLNLWIRQSDLISSLRQRVLFVGWNEEAERLAHAFATDHASPYELMGCVSPGDRELTRSPHDSRLVLGTEEDLSTLLDERRIDIVMLADLNGSQSEIMTLANHCEKKMVQFKVLPSYFQILVSGLHLETISGIPILGVTRLPLDRCSNICVKRIVDIVGALFGLLFLPPLFAIFGAMIYLESPGPLLFRQERRGRNGRPFWMYKIRSMKFGAEKMDHLSQSTGRLDSRLLKVGALLRRWNLDEVPQFWNVLRGEMSLVGPRPERTFHCDKLSDEIPHYNARHNVKPGITGWAQVKGFRGDTDLVERVKCDLYYLENWSLLLDFQIMIMTFLRRDNAY